MRLSIFILLFTLCQFNASAQDRNYMELIKTYRIPETHYSLSTVNVSGFYSLNNQDTEWSSSSAGTDTKNEGLSFFFNLRPDFTMVRESDLNPWLINLVLWSSYDHYHSESDNGSTTNTLNQHSFSIQPIIEYQYRQYGNANTDLYWGSSGEMRIDWDQQNRVSTSTGLTKRTDDQFSKVIQFEWTSDGVIGIGRQRNVTPLVNAIRLSDRFRQLFPAHPGFSDPTLTALADEFSRFDDYLSLYDRPNRAFRNAIGQIIQTTDFDQYDYVFFDEEYLFDVLKEFRFVRYYGWLLEGGLESDYSITDNYYRTLDKRDQPPLNQVTLTSSLRESWYLLPLIRFDWMDLFDLYSGHQFQAEIKGGPQVSNLNQGNPRQKYLASMSWDYYREVADNMLLSGGPYLDISRFNYLDRPFIISDERIDVGFSARFQYFALDELSYNLFLSLSQLSVETEFQNGTRNTTSLNINATLSLDFYFYRHLISGINPFE